MCIFRKSQCRSRRRKKDWGGVQHVFIPQKEDRLDEMYVASHRRHTDTMAQLILLFDKSVLVIMRFGAL